MTNKTISINPQLFSMSGSKTRKNKEKKEKVNVIPLISPNVLKNKLLKRIKEHKQRETENLNSNNDTKNKKESAENNISNTNYADEFTESISYLQTLSKQKKINEEKANYEKKKERDKQILHSQTLKNYNSIQNNPSPIINIELPEELNFEMPKPIEQSSILLNKPIIGGNNVPYGILKGGTKPTYRDWNKTQKANIVTNPNLAVTVGQNIISEREMRLNNLRNKLKMKQIESEKKSINNANLIKTPLLENTLATNSSNAVNASNTNNTNNSVNSSNSVNASNSVNSNNVTNLENEEIIGTKKITKKTIKRKYTLGKSSLKNVVSVLVKDRGTRKQVLSAQKDLKKKSIKIKLFNISEFWEDLGTKENLNNLKKNIKNILF